MSATATSTSDFPIFGVKASHLKYFVQCHFLSNIAEDAAVKMTTTDVCEKVVKPLTAAAQTSYCDYLLNLDIAGDVLPSSVVGKAEVFISHAWKYTFLEVVDAILEQFSGNLDIYIWFDLFSNNQHKAVSNDFHWWCNTFRSAIADIKHVVMILSPWFNPIPFTRAWCLFELYSSAITKCSFEIAMSREQRRLFLEDISDNCEKAISNMLSKIDCEKSECFYIEDRNRIFDVVRSSIGFDALNSLVFKQFRSWVLESTSKEIEDCDDPVKKVLLKKSLGDLYHGMGHHSKSEPILVACLDEFTTLFGKDGEQTIKLMISLANCYNIQSKFDLAGPLFVAILEKQDTLWGSDHVDTLGAQNNLALFYTQTSKFDEAEKLFTQCLAKRSAILGENSIDALRTLHNLSLMYVLSGKSEIAIPLYEKCLLLRRSALGDRHTDTLRTLNNLAGLYVSRKDYERALPMLEECYVVRSTLLGPFHSEAVTSLFHLGRCTFEFSDLLKSEELLLKSEELLTKALELKKEISVQGSSFSGIVSYSITLSSVYKTMEKLDKSKEVLEICLETLRFRNPNYNKEACLEDVKSINTLNDHSLVRDWELELELLREIANIYVILKQFTTGENLIREFYNLSKATLGERNKLTIYCQRDLGLLLIRISESLNPIAACERDAESESKK